MSIYQLPDIISYQLADTIKSVFISVRDYFVSLDWPSIIATLKVIAVVASFLLFVGIVFVILGLNTIYKVRRAIELFIAARRIPKKKKKLVKKWKKIEQRLKSGQEAELKLAVIEADKFFDDILKKIGYLGKDMGERLRKINSSQIANIDDIWSAHKVRNNIVHDVDFRLTEFETERTVRAYKKALEELEVV